MVVQIVYIIWKEPLQGHFENSSPPFETTKDFMTFIFLFSPLYKRFCAVRRQESYSWTNISEIDDKHKDTQFLWLCRSPWKVNLPPWWRKAFPISCWCCESFQYSRESRLEEHSRESGLEDGWWWKWVSLLWPLVVGELSNSDTQLQVCAKLLNKFFGFLVPIRACNGYYGPCFGEPVCATCHAFLYASRYYFSPFLPQLSFFFSSLENEIQLQMISEEQNSDDDCDSGNDEPSDYLPLERRASVSGTPQQERAGGEEEAPALTRSQFQQHRDINLPIGSLP